jgi:hypothetical protein
MYTSEVTFLCRSKKQMTQKPSFLPKTWKAGRDVTGQGELPVQVTPSSAPNVVHQVTQNVRESTPEVPKDHLDVPTFLCRQAQKA